MEREWEKEKEKILNSLLGSSQELEFPTEAEVSEGSVLLKYCIIFVQLFLRNKSG